VTIALSKKYARANAAIIVASVLVLAATWLVTQERLAFEHETAVAEAAQRSAGLALAFEEHTLRVLKDVDHALVLVKNEYLDHGAQLDLKRLIAAGELDPKFVRITVFDEHANPVLRSSVFNPLNVADEDYFKAHVGRSDRQVFVDKPHLDFATGRWMIEFSRRIERDDGTFAGVVSMTAPPHIFAKDFQRSLLGDDGVITLVGSTDRITRMRRIGQEITAGQNVEASQLVEEQKRRPSGTFRSAGAIDGTLRYVGFRTLENYPFIVSVGASEGRMLANYLERRTQYHRIAAVISIFVVLLAVVLLAALERHRSILLSLVGSEARLRAVFNQAFVGMTIHALDGRPIKVNRATCEILGYEPEELLDMDPRQVVHPDDVPPDGDFRGDFHAKERRFIRKDGTTVWTNATETLVRDAHGNPECYVSVLQDISEFKRANQVKSEFVSMVSHELRTPLTSIRGSLGLVAGGVAGALPSAASNLIEIAKNNCERLIRLINDILDSEKIESGNIRFDLKDVPLAALLERALADNQGFAAEHGVRLALHVPQYPVQVHVDTDRLLQVVTNLLSNAVKFSPRDGTVDVSVAVVDGRARVEVRDRGPGIPEEFRARIFQKFAQADSSDTRARGGTGLGLNISRAIIERLHGTLGFTTGTGVGTTFAFELPLAAVPEEVQAAPVPAPPQAAPPRAPGLARILHVEDDPDICWITSAIARDFATVESASTLAQARAALARSRFDLVLLDLHFPDGSGWELVAEIESMAVPPRVAIFSMADVGDENIGRTSAVLLKAHTSNEQLADTIRRLVAGSIPACASSSSAAPSSSAPPSATTGQSR
jgi:PAS domain S-box-containing protein